MNATANFYLINKYSNFVPLPFSPKIPHVVRIFELRGQETVWRHGSTLTPSLSAIALTIRKLMETKCRHAALTLFKRAEIKRAIINLATDKEIQPQ